MAAQTDCVEGCGCDDADGAWWPLRWAGVCLGRGGEEGGARRGGTARRALTCWVARGRSACQVLGSARYLARSECCVERR